MHFLMNNIYNINIIKKFSKTIIKLKQLYSVINSEKLSLINNNKKLFSTINNDDHLVIIDNNYLFDKIPRKQIRNFSIIAHVDHGKSTLADRLLEYTGTINKNLINKQVLDSLQVERERGITVKAQTVSLLYRYNNKIYLLNLIDTPGHVDFSNEVTRSLAACDGVILLIDANHGIQAQTVSNYYLAKKRNLNIITVLNKIDLKQSNPERVCSDIKTLFNIESKDVLKISAKLGTGIDEVLKNIILKLPPPAAAAATPLPSPDEKEIPFSALLFDSWYDRYRGALNLICVKSGELHLGDEITVMSSKKSYEIKSISIMRTIEYPVKSLKIGQVGLIGCNMRNSKEAIIGDTIYLKGKPCNELIGIKSLQPMVFAGVYPCEQIQHIQLRNAIEKLCLNDSAVTFVPDSSPALGQGWRLGFLGLLHMEVFCQRLEQEYGTEPIMTAPSVTYKIKLRESKKMIKHNQENIIYISNPSLLPSDENVDEYYEPFILGTIITPVEYVGKIISLCVEKRGVEMESINIDETRIMMKYLLPLSDVIFDFYDHLKACSSGYASFDYEEYGYHPTNIVKLTIQLNGQPIEELSTIVHTTKVSTVGRDMVKRLKDLIPRQMVQIAVQSCVGSKVIARETIKAYRKDVTAKLYGGDVTRRMKLLRQQAEGKKKMRSIANINIPRNTFINVLKR